MVRFNSEDSGDLSLPRPELLSIHFAIAEILHAFGFAEEIDISFRDISQIGCLSEGGSTDAGHLVRTVLAAA